MLLFLNYSRPSLFEEAGQYFDKDTGVLEAPMVIRVADQVFCFTVFSSVITHVCF